MKKMVLILCSVILLFAAPSNVYAATAPVTNSNASLDEKDMLLFVSEISGDSGDSLTALFEDGQARASSESPQLTDIKLYFDEGQIVFESILMYSGTEMDLHTFGTLYKNEKTENSGMSENLVLAEMEDVNGVHFVQFKFDKTKSELYVILQLTDSEELLSFNIPITTSIFNDFYNLEDNPVSGRELEEKIASLYSVSRNLLNAEDDTTEYEWSSPTCTMENTVEPRGTFNGWVNLFNDLKDGSAKLSNHPDVNADFFKGTGWQDDNAWNLPYMLMSYSKANGPDEYLTQFTLLDATAQNYDITTGKYKLALQLKYSSGALVSYDKYTDILTIIYYDFGLSFNDVYVGVGNLTDNAFFIDRTVSRKYLESGNVVKTFITLFPPAEIASDIFDSLAMGTNQPATEIEYFEQDYNKQIAKYQGSIIKGIVATTEDKQLTIPGHLINIGGTASFNSTIGFSWVWAYKFLCKHYI